jgi:hypothetical protein
MSKMDLPTLKQIGLRMDALAREYGHTLPGDPRRAEIVGSC